MASRICGSFASKENSREKCRNLKQVISNYRRKKLYHASKTEIEEKKNFAYLILGASTVCIIFIVIYLGNHKGKKCLRKFITSEGYKARVYEQVKRL